MSAPVNSSHPAAAFRALHQRGSAFIIPNPWDVGTARILASLGFEALATTSAGMAFSMGVRDGVATRDDVLAHCRSIVDATPLPVSADLEGGFGDSPEVVAETVRLAAETGLAGCSIEDHTGRADAPIYEFEAAVERVGAAVETARSLPQDFVLTARCENFLWGRRDLDDTIRRLQGFEAAGADVLYAPGLRDLDSIRTLCDAVSRPVNAIMGLPGVSLSKDQLSSVGVARISVGSGLSRVAIGAFIRAAEEMRDHGSFEFGNEALGFKEIERHF